MLLEIHAEFGRLRGHGRTKGLKLGHSSSSRWQRPLSIEKANWHRSKQLHSECEWKQGDSAGREEKPF